ncbi:hypothetical protein V491_06343 [Pseudogymnoascus sp. VKM F-3775]|nr:hypothetical protein V491_06343 [Pseudogymnoascus sp. VKM F-3775]
MASVQSDQQPPLRSSAQGHRSGFTTTNTSRLRDSCHACASSKVKCGKEKPTCSRCAKRVTRCEYLITKRPGRRHNSRPSDRDAGIPMTTITTDNGPVSSALSVWPETVSAVSRADPLPSPSYSVQQSNPSTFPELVSEFDEFFNSPTFSPPDVSNFEFSDVSNFESSDASNFELSDASNFELSDASNPWSGGKSTSSSSTSISGKNHPNPVPPEDIIYLFGKRSRSPSLPSDSTTGKLPKTSEIYGNFTKDFETSHRCFPYALDTLNKLFAGDETACMMSLGDHGYSRSNGQRPSSVHTIISRNEHAIDALSRILKCSCSANSFLLTIVALVIFKVLDWYAHAAKMATAGEDETLNGNPYSNLPSPRHRSAESTVGSGRQQNDRDYDRQSAQLVLVELHRVQRVLSHLSPKLQACGPEPQSRRGSTASSQPSMVNPRFSEDVLTMTSLPFSSLILEQLEPEVRNRIRSLSAEIIGFLRQD